MSGVPAEKVTSRKTRVSIKSGLTHRSSGSHKTVEKEEIHPIFVPRPFKKHRHDILLHRAKKLLNLDESDAKFEFSETDERVKTVPFGCLSFHILELHNVSVSVSAFEVSAPIFYYAIVNLGRSKRVTKCVMSSRTRRVRLDAVVVLSCELSEWRENYKNRMKIEFWAFQDPEKHYVIGTSTLHLYNFVHHIHGIESCYIWGDGVLRGKMIYEYAFSYGAFGYGHSTQFRNTDVPILQAVSNSLFPRVQLEEEDIFEEQFNTCLPSRIKLMTSNSFIQERSADPRRPNETVPKSMTLQQVEFEEGYPVHCKTFMPIYQSEIEADFSDAYGDYVCLPKRSERMEFCRKLLEGRRTDIREDEYATPLFQQLAQGEIEEILLKGDDMSAMTYPANRNCSYGHKTVVYAEDEKMFEAMPVTDRSSGYLGRLFGLGGEHEPGDEPANFPIEDLQFLKIKHRSEHSLRLWARYIWSRFGAFLTFVRHTILPVNTKHHLVIPEISVTLPSPQLSATNLNVLWVEPDIPKSVLNEEQVFREEAQRFGLPPDDEPLEHFLQADKNDVGQGDTAADAKPIVSQTEKVGDSKPAPLKTETVGPVNSAAAKPPPAPKKKMQ